MKNLKNSPVKLVITLSQISKIRTYSTLATRFIPLWNNIT